MVSGKKEKSWKIGFLKKLGIGVVSTLAFFGLTSRANANAERNYYNYLDKGFYSYINEVPYSGNYHYLDRGKYKVADNDMYRYLDNWQYKHDDFYYQEIYKDFHRKRLAHPYSPANFSINISGVSFPNTKIFRMPQTNPVAQSDYFRMVDGYKDPHNMSLNFYLVRYYFGDAGIYNPSFKALAVPKAPYIDSPLKLERDYSSSFIRQYLGDCSSLKPSSVVLPFSDDGIDPIPEPATIALLGLGGLVLLKGEQKRKLKRKRLKKN